MNLKSDSPNGWLPGTELVRVLEGHSNLVSGVALPARATMPGNWFRSEASGL
jgi:hypothetical protein